MGSYKDITYSGFCSPDARYGIDVRLLVDYYLSTGQRAIILYVDSSLLKAGGLMETPGNMGSGVNAEALEMVEVGQITNNVVDLVCESLDLCVCIDVGTYGKNLVSWLESHNIIVKEESRLEIYDGNRSVLCRLTEEFLRDHTDDRYA